MCDAGALTLGVVMKHLNGTVLPVQAGDVISLSRADGPTEYAKVLEVVDIIDGRVDLEVVMFDDSKERRCVNLPLEILPERVVMRSEDASSLMMLELRFKELQITRMICDERDEEMLRELRRVKMAVLSLMMRHGMRPNKYWSL